MTALCKSCGAPILWARTAAGKAIPLDASPHELGNLELQPDGSVRFLPVNVQAIGPRYMAHFSTCPQAAEHRRTR